MVDNAITSDTYNQFERNIKTRYEDKYVEVGSNMTGRTFSLDDQGEISFEILGPVKNFYDTGSKKAEKSNNSSIILKMIYTPKSTGTGDDSSDKIRVVTHYTVMENGRAVQRENIRDIVNMGTISSKGISNLVSRQQENSSILLNRANFQSILDNGLGSMQGLNVNDNEAVRKALYEGLLRMVVNKASSSSAPEGTYAMEDSIDIQGRLNGIMSDMPENTYERTKYYKILLEMEIYNVFNYQQHV
jgi:hypothetical protein